ncbi:hypothetical protein V1291_002057 [Nitrobacteraceae bacterium AZCC 1564]
MNHECASGNSVPKFLSQSIEPWRDTFVSRRNLGTRASLALSRTMGAEMTPNETRRTDRRDFVLAAIMVAGGLVVSGISLMQLAARDQLQFAQTTQPPTDRPSVPPGKDNGPADPKPGGTRPTTPPPEPARPDADAQKGGAKPALPPAPAEKMGEPVRK